MKVNYSRLRCPYCGADDFSLSGADVFLCHYCNEKFKFNLDEIEFTAKNKVFVQELKEQFNAKVKESYNKISFYKKKLNHYNKLAYPKGLKIFSVVGMIFSLMFISLFPLLSLFSILFFLGLLVLSFQLAKRSYNKFHSISMHYASKIVACENEISFYTKLMSKLTI